MMDLLSAIAVPPEQAIWVFLSVCLAALMRAFTGFGFAMLAVPVFSLFLSPGDTVVLSAALALILGLIGYRSWWRQFPVAPAVPMISGSVIGTAIGVWFLASLSVAQFQLWIGLSVVVASVALSRAEARERVASPTVSAEYRRAVWLDEWGFCDTGAASGDVCHGNHGKPRAFTCVSHDVFRLLQHRVTHHVCLGRSGHTAAVPIAVDRITCHVGGESAG